MYVSGRVLLITQARSRNGFFLLYINSRRIRTILLMKSRLFCSVIYDNRAVSPYRPSLVLQRTFKGSPKETKSKKQSMVDYQTEP